MICLALQPAVSRIRRVKCRGGDVERVGVKGHAALALHVKTEQLHKPVLQLGLVTGRRGAGEAAVAVGVAQEKSQPVLDDRAGVGLPPVVLRKHPFAQVAELRGGRPSLRTKPLVIITTAYPEFALEGFELDVVRRVLTDLGVDMSYQVPAVLFSFGYQIEEPRHARTRRALEAVVQYV